MARKRKILIKRRRASTECYFCKQGKEPIFSDSQTLSRFLTERGKIIARSRTGLCALHQRRLAKNIKHARHLALLPFVAR